MAVIDILYTGVCYRTTTLPVLKQEMSPMYLEVPENFANMEVTLPPLYTLTKEELEGLLPL
jgi:hypothetical protein